MKISNVEAKYVLNLKNRQVVVEESRNEKGEKIYSFYVLTSAKLSNGEEWNEDLSNAKTIEKREDLPENLRKILRNVLSSL
ncbi:hypothetical protein [Sulfurisphaera tokodaii]|uniref:Uncharacterized protein n=2 Tax=Sulfurisphaera tokodaii TaxID=111955 RepID=F9VMH1_SULTO|nr:hypothetical protein [Sulfurisphaera tokodaii]BAK61783.1 hypothetical protein STK_14705 [Sulfurisphaera tokodaii str. 7]HII73643.1 hypothetical protein [Sulfurisphaera tokodaii]